MQKRFLHPRYWLIWLMFGSLRLINLLPFTVQMRLGRLVGFIVRILSARRRHIAEVNLRLCFPEWSEDQRRAVLRKHFAALGMSFFEFGISWWWSDQRFSPLAHVSGLEHLQAALAKNRGVILLAGHFTTLEIISRVLRQHYHFHPMYRRNNNPLIESIISNGRIRHCGEVIPHDDLRALIRSLRSNTPVLYIPDQNFGRKHAIFVPFFGIQTATVTATARLAGIDNTPVVPVMQKRLDNDRGYQLTIEPALENFPSGDLEADITRVNALFEEQVRDNPDDYLWVHRRFKTRPEGEPSLYN